MFADQIVVTVQATTPAPVNGFDGYEYLPRVYRCLEGGSCCGPLVANVYVYENEDKDEDHCVFVQCLHGEGDTVNELLDSIFTPAGMPVDGVVADAVSKLARACLFGC